MSNATAVIALNSQPKPTCSVDGCDRVAASVGMCRTHYWRTRKNGEPGGPITRKVRPKGTVEALFWAKVGLPNPQTGCMEWLATKKPAGYGAFGGRGYLEYAHRFAYELCIAPIPDGLHIDHLCRNRACVRPDHLEAVTPRENCLRGEGPSAQCARRTHCSKGHPFDEENTAIVSTTGRRYCKECNRARARANTAKKRDLGLTRKVANDSDNLRQ